MGGRGASSSKGEIQSKIEARPMLDIKTKNKIEKEIKEIIPDAKIKMSTLNVGIGFTDAEYNGDKGKQKFVKVDAGTRYMPSGYGVKPEITKERERRILGAFKILEKYNKDYKFDYMVDKKKYKSDGTNFKNKSNSVKELL